tara:strand:- start:875 stop:1642 length:768 start_codon:yes stop_codon:yes gene_type:complete
MEASVASDDVLVVVPLGPEEERLKWFESVKADLRKASEVYKEALAKETHANMAVFVAEAEWEAALESANAHGTRLKQQHTAAVALVNEAEAAVGDAIAEVARRKWRFQSDWAVADLPVDETGVSVALGGTDNNPLAGFGVVVDAYRKAYESRAKVLYVCHTETLASRQALGQAARKRDVCKTHLVTVVKERNVAEEELARIHALYVDKHDDPKELLEVQLARTRCAAGASPEQFAEQCAPTPFGAHLVANMALFA